MAGKLLDRVEDVLAWIAGAVLVVMMLAISYSVFSRFALGRPLAGVVEWSGYLLLYVAFLGLPWLLRNRGHINVELIYDRVGPRGRRGLDVLAAVLGLFVTGILTWRGIIVTADVAERGLRLWNVLQTPQWMLVVVIPLGAGLAFLEFIRFFRAAVSSQKPVHPAQPPATREG